MARHDQATIEVRWWKRIPCADATATRADVVVAMFIGAVIGHRESCHSTMNRGVLAKEGRVK